jgi:hypothetical protein
LSSTTATPPPPPDERAQALSPEITLRAPIDEGAQAPTPELSLRAVDQDMSSWMAGTKSIKLIRMTGGPEEMSTLGSGPPMVNALETGTVELSAEAQGAPTTTQGINAREAAAASAPPPKIRLFSKETRPFNYARLQEDEAPHLHTLSFKENARDKGEESAERASDKKDDASFAETEHYAPSSDGSDLGDQMDRLLNGGMPLSRGGSDNNDDAYDDGSTLVDYNEDESEDDLSKVDDGFRVNMDDDEDCLAQEDEVGDEQSATHDTGDNSSEGQPSLEQPPASEQATSPEIRHENVVDPIGKPVLTQQAIMEIIKRQPHAVMQKVGWEQKKQTCKELLSGYESPNGTSMNVAVGLTALMFGSAVSESAQMISLMAQSEASDKLAKQAERHRKLLEKEFTQSMERMRAEHEKTITEAIKSRDKYARSALEATNTVEQTMQKIDQAQCDNVINFQLECLKKRAQKYEQRLQDVTEKYEEELRQKEITSDNQRKELAKERKKNKDLEKELREYEDSVMSGIVPKAAMSRKSPDSSPDIPTPKRIRTEVINVDSDKKAMNLNMSMTTAYTETPRNNANLKVMTNDPSSIRPSGHQAAEQTMGEASTLPAPLAWTNQESSSAAVKTRAELNPRLLPKPVMTNVINPPVERAPGSCLHIEPEPPVITPQQKLEALKMWKDLLIETKDYVPYQHKPYKNINFLSNAMKGFRESKLKGLKAMQWEHGQFGPIQHAMHIPKVLCMPDKFFEEWSEEEAPQVGTDQGAGVGD